MTLPSVSVSKPYAAAYSIIHISTSSLIFEFGAVSILLSSSNVSDSDKWNSMYYTTTFVLLRSVNKTKSRKKTQLIQMRAKIKI